MSEEQFFSDKPQANILAQVVHRYLPFWPIFVLLTFVALLFAYIDLRSQTNIYVAASSVLLKDPQKSPDSKVLEAMNIFSDKKIVENEVLVLKSASIVTQVVKDLNLYNSVYNEGKVRTEELYGTNSPIQFIAADKNNIASHGKYYFSIDWDKKLVEIDGRTLPFNSTLTIGGSAYLLKVNEAYNSTVKGKNFFVIFGSVQGVVSAISGALKIAPQSYASTVLNITMETPVPPKGVDILNKLVDVYNTAGILDKNQIAVNTIAFIDARINTVTGQLDSVEKNIENYRLKEGITDLTGQASLYFDNVKDLDKRNTELALKKEGLRDIENYINSKGQKPGTVPSLMLVSDPTLANLLQQLYTSEFDRDKAMAVSGNQSEAVTLAIEKINRTKKDIQENINNIRRNFDTQQADINANLSRNN
ncbi:MAG: hypothetical protein JSU03_14485, partial [Bacteroidetes bacterium]|nr:hypothetical protein [Bacteroidota bacterium]